MYGTSAVETDRNEGGSVFRALVFKVLSQRYNIICKAALPSAASRIIASIALVSNMVKY